MDYIRRFIFGNFLAIFVALCSFSSPSSAEPRSTEAAALIVEGLTTAGKGIKKFNEKFDADFRSGRLLPKDGKLFVIWPNNSGRFVVGEASFIGDFSLKHGIWVWAWGNKQAPRHASEASHAIKAYAETHKIAAFLKPRQRADIGLAEKLASMAVLFDDYELVFGSRNSDAVLFVAVSGIRWAKN